VSRACERLVPLLVFLLGCGRGGGTSENVAPTREDGSVRPADGAVALPASALGMSGVDGFAYRTRAGQEPFRRARDSEAADDWAAVTARCKEALAADPDHLDAAYLLAVALAKTGAGAEQILVPLAKAVGGDFGKWGAASLEQPALQPFLATAIGQAWRRRVEEDRAAFVAALARSVLVTSQQDLYAFDPQTTRWHRLTRTGGAVVGALHVPSQHAIAYVTRQRANDGKPRTKVGVGIVELATGRTWKSVEIPNAPTTLRIGYATKKTTGFVVRAGKQAWRVAEKGKLTLEALPAKLLIDTPAYLADMMRLEVRGSSARLDRVAVANVAADWDDQSLASAIKIGRSKRVVTVPSPGLIDGDTATWSADATQLAFVAQLSDTCEPGVATAAAFVADAATGRVQELERALGGIAIEWASERTLAVAGDRGVSIVALAGSDPLVLTGADGLVTPREKPTCVPEPVLAEPPVIEEEEAGSATSRDLHDPVAPTGNR
jgi:hypothetical protein